MLKKLEAVSANRLQILLAGLAVLLAVRLIYIQHGWINDDSVLYFEVARLFADGAWKQGLILYNWSLYSALIALVHNATGLSLQSSAQILTVIFFGIAASSYFSLIRLAGGNNMVMACGALVLFSAPYVVGDVLPMLLRDQGFWAFLLTGLVFFIQFHRTGSLRHALLWQSCGMIAVLFRIEAITFLALLPFVLLTDNTRLRREKLWRFMQSHSLNLLAAIALITTLLASSIALNDLGRLKEVFSLESYYRLGHGLIEKSAVMGREVLGSFLDEFALSSLIVALLFIVIAKIISGTGWITVGLLAIGLKTKATQRIAADARRILCWVAGLAVLNMSMIIMNVFVLSGRYGIALIFILMIFAAFFLAALVDDGQAQSKLLKKRLLIGILILLSLSLVRNILPKANGYNYEQNAVSWVKSNAAMEKAIFYASPRSRYYAGAPYAGRGVDYWAVIRTAIGDGSIRNYDYLLLNIDEDYDARKKYLIDTLHGYHLIKEFPDARLKKRILVFSRN